jgi:hypothetical protein
VFRTVIAQEQDLSTDFVNLQAKISIRLMFTSRFIPEVTEKFHSDPMLEVRASEHDIRRYIAGQLPPLLKCISAVVSLYKVFRTKSLRLWMAYMRAWQDQGIKV